MNITFILGNGFDLNLNLHTDYKSFYNYYKNLPSVGEYADAIAKVKMEFNDFLARRKGDVLTGTDSIDWSDLESGLGQYVNEIPSEDEYEAVYYDIRNSLRDYLKIQEAHLPLLPPIDMHSFYQDLTGLEHYLLPADIINFLAFKQTCNSKHYYIRILTFNYTKTFEHIIGNNKSYVLPDGEKADVSEVRHIHRLIDQLILGVNDVTQVDNHTLKELTFVQETLIKPSHCSTYGDNNAANCIEYIGKADLIVLYGVSLGKTDNKWWQALASKMRRDDRTRIMIFWFEKDYPDYTNDAPRRSRAERKVFDKLSSMMGLSASEKATFQKRIYVHLIKRDKRIFDLPKLPDLKDV